MKAVWDIRVVLARPPGMQAFTAGDFAARGSSHSFIVENILPPAVCRAQNYTLGAHGPGLLVEKSSDGF